MKRFYNSKREIPCIIFRAWVHAGPICWVIEKEAMKYNLDARKEMLNMDSRFREGLKVSAAPKLTCQKFLSIFEKRK